MQCPGRIVTDSPDQRVACGCWSGHQFEFTDVQSLHDHGPSGHNGHLA